MTRSGPYGFRAWTPVAQLGKEQLELQPQQVKHNETLRQAGIQGERKCRSDDVSIWEDKLKI